MTPRGAAAARMRLASLVTGESLERQLADLELAWTLALERLRVLQTGAGVEDDDLIVLADPSVPAEVRRAGEACGTLGTDEHAFGLACGAHQLGDLLILHGDRDALRFAKRAQHDEVAEGLGTRMPAANVRGSGHGSDSGRPSVNAFPMGPQPVDCTATNP